MGVMVLALAVAPAKPATAASKLQNEAEVFFIILVFLSFFGDGNAGLHWACQLALSAAPSEEKYLEILFADRISTGNSLRSGRENSF